MAKPTPPAPGTQRKRRLPPEVLEAQAHLIAARAEALTRIKNEKRAKLLALQAKLNDRLDAVEAKLEKLG